MLDCTVGRKNIENSKDGARYLWSRSRSHDLIKNQEILWIRTDSDHHFQNPYGFIGSVIIISKSHVNSYFPKSIWTHRWYSRCWCQTSSSDFGSARLCFFAVVWIFEIRNPPSCFCSELTLLAFCEFVVASVVFALSRSAGWSFSELEKCCVDPFWGHWSIWYRADIIFKTSKCGCGCKI